MIRHYNTPTLLRPLLFLSKDFRRDTRFFKYFPVYDYKTILDIGAYKGEFTDRFLRNFKVNHVFLFEPLKEQYNYLCNKYSSDNRCSVFPFALGHISGSSILYRLNQMDSSSLLSPKKQASIYIDRPFYKESQVNIQTRRLCDISELKDISFYDIAKIDVQGAEVQVLEGMADILHRVRSLYIEVNFISLYDNGATFCDTHRFLINNGFFLNFFQEFRRNKKGALVYANALYINSYMT